MQSPLKLWLLRGGERIRFESLKPESGCAARQKCQTAEHDQHKEKVRAAATGFVRHITVFSDIYICGYPYVYTHISTHFPVGVGESHNRALIFYNSHSDDENNNTIRSIRAVTML